MSKDKEKITFQGLTYLCNSMGIDPLDLTSSLHSEEEIKTHPKSFSVSGLKALRDHINMPPQYETCSTLEECTQVIQRWVEHSESRVVCTTNFQTMMEAQVSRRLILVI